MTDVTVTVQDGVVFALIDGQRFDDDVIFQTHNTPARRDDGDSITWSWSSQ